MKKGKLYLIPCTLGESPLKQVLPPYLSEIIKTIHEFIVENEKPARRFIKKVGYEGIIQDIVFHNMGKHANKDYLHLCLTSLEKGNNIGVISDAGCPGVADPGSEIISIAHKKNIEVVPLVGPSSILLTLMASGLNGQNFCFNGYLPIDSTERIVKIKELEKESSNKKQTQLFIETPYRNNALFETFTKHLNPLTKLCIASNITLENQSIRTLTINEWKNKKIDLHKQNTVFAFLT